MEEIRAGKEFIIIKNLEELDNVVKEGGYKVIVITLENCHSCNIAEHFISLYRKHCEIINKESQIKYYVLDLKKIVDKNDVPCNYFHILKVPTIVYIRGSIIVNKDINYDYNSIKSSIDNLENESCETI